MQVTVRKKECVCKAGWRAFTLIELLIVVLIIAILAAIAIPNFLEFQTRAKISRAKNDMRTLKTGLEAYAVENNAYIPDLFGYGMWQTWAALTTPISYLTSIPPSPFKIRNYMGVYNNYGQEPFDYGNYDAQNGRPAREYAIRYIILCPGPDEDSDFPWYDSVIEVDQQRDFADISGNAVNAMYDPTNGTVSSGDVLVTNKAMY
jgi:prepilin-type N-terminal cleavage/methylation domain-containing protein